MNEAKKPETSYVNKRPQGSRFSIRLPLTILTGEREVLGLTSNLSNGGFCSYLSCKDLELVGPTFECFIDFPPEVTHSISRRIHCKAELLRTRKLSNGEALVAARIIEYKFEPRDETL